MTLPICLVAGFGRCGTTLVMRMLDRVNKAGPAQAIVIYWSKHFFFAAFPPCARSVPVHAGSVNRQALRKSRRLVSRRSTTTRLVYHKTTIRGTQATKSPPTRRPAASEPMTGRSSSESKTV